jgi:hypothetical protein
MESILRRELDERDQQEEIMFRQKSRMLWLKEGDKNTKFFHNSLLQRRNQNWIHSLKMEEGVMVERHEDIEQSLINYFSDLLSEPPQDRGKPPTSSKKLFQRWSLKITTKAF